jgi:hypothetical protein
MVRVATGMADVLTHLGGVSSETTLVLVPEAQAEVALSLIAETVTDYEGDELEALLRSWRPMKTPARVRGGAGGA